LRQSAIWPLLAKATHMRYVQGYLMIRIIHTLGGCGGTILSRCIGVLPGIALFSEINPASIRRFSYLDPLYQDRNWIHLLEAAELERFSELDLEKAEAFREVIAALHVRAVETGRHLVLRDFNLVDFVGIPFCASPPQKLTLYAALPAAIPTRSVAFIRHPMDQWSSICKHEEVRDLTPSTFCNAYAAFLHELGDIPIHRYEDFVERPKSCLQAICEDLLLPFDPAFIDRFQSFDYVTGDFSRHQEKSISAPAKRSLPPQALEEFRACGTFKLILSATGYEELGTPGPLQKRANAGGTDSSSLGLA
jgi:hypothetical protein